MRLQLRICVRALSSAVPTGATSFSALNPSAEAAALLLFGTGCMDEVSGRRYNSSLNLIFKPGRLVVYTFATLRVASPDL